MSTVDLTTVPTSVLREEIERRESKNTQARKAAEPTGNPIYNLLTSLS
jgi:hypothetical protein